MNVSCGSPYYNPHVQRPAIFPPSDGYQPPEDPLVGVVRQIQRPGAASKPFPQLPMVGTAYTYLQDYLPHVAQAVVREGWIDLVGLGRMVLSYPDLPAGRPAAGPAATETNLPDLQRLHDRAAERHDLGLLSRWIRTTKTCPWPRISGGSSKRGDGAKEGTTEETDSADRHGLEKTQAIRFRLDPLDPSNPRFLLSRRPTCLKSAFASPPADSPEIRFFEAHADLRQVGLRGASGKSWLLLRPILSRRASPTILQSCQNWKPDPVRRSVWLGCATRCCRTPR